MEAALEAMVSAGGLGHRLLDDETRALLIEVENLRRDVSHLEDTRSVAEATKSYRSTALQYLQDTHQDLQV